MKINLSFIKLFQNTRYLYNSKYKINDAKIDSG